jgi:class 3 adenylate cyclase
MLQVTRVAILFSDLTDSTALYTRAGDAVAFKLVQDHFDVLFACVQKHEGTVVKTIGDAIMAAFVDEDRALAAALEMQHRFQDTGPAFQGTRLSLKIGLFAGPCYAVTANGVLDYFGQSVNVAARLQATASSQEVVVPLPLAERALAKGAFSAHVVTERFDAVLKGVGNPVRAARLRPLAP